MCSGTSALAQRGEIEDKNTFHKRERSVPTASEKCKKRLAFFPIRNAHTAHTWTFFRHGNYEQRRVALCEGPAHARAHNSFQIK